MFVQKKRTKEKGAGNDNFTPAVRLLHMPCWRYRPVRSSHHFRVPLAPPFMKFCNIMHVFWISIGLREFWEIATVLKLAERACCKQYCMRRTKDDELYCVGKLKNRNPKIICSLDLFWLLFSIKRKK